ncbi:hypothetical protein AGIG_G7460 [Arapaima gigas]
MTNKEPEQRWQRVRFSSKLHGTAQRRGDAEDTLTSEQKAGKPERRGEPRDKRTVYAGVIDWWTYCWRQSFRAGQDGKYR